MSSLPLARRAKRFSAPVIGRSEQGRKKIVKYVFWVYWLLIFEGALRKWIFPEFHEIIFFARDPIVFLIYLLALRYNFFRRGSLLFLGMAIALLYLPLLLVQLAVVDVNPLTLIYGWRMYFAYLPLIFVIQETFQQVDIYRLFRQTLLVSIPLAGLVFVQFISPRDSFINAAYSEGAVFVVSGTIVRTTGTFTFTAGQSMFAASLVAMLIIAWLYRKRAPVLSLPWLLVATLAGTTTLLLSGSRTAFFMAALIILSTLFGLLFTKGTAQKVRGVTVIVFLVLVGGLLFMGPFRDSYDAIGTRFEQAEKAEGSALHRAFIPLYAFVDHIITVPAIGYGVGYGTGGGSRIATGKAKLVLAEDEWSRIVMEAGPIFGLFYIGYRIVLTFVAFRGCVGNARTNNSIPIILFGFIGYYLLAGSITHTASLHGYTWIFVGLMFAAMKARSQTGGGSALVR